MDLSKEVKNKNSKPIFKFPRIKLTCTNVFILTAFLCPASLFVCDYFNMLSQHIACVVFATFMGITWFVSGLSILFKVFHEV